MCEHFSSFRHKIKQQNYFLFFVISKKSCECMVVNFVLSCKQCPQKLHFRCKKVLKDVQIFVFHVLSFYMKRQWTKNYTLKKLTKNSSITFIIFNPIINFFLSAFTKIYQFLVYLMLSIYNICFEMLKLNKFHL